MLRLALGARYFRAGPMLMAPAVLKGAQAERRTVQAAPELVAVVAAAARTRFAASWRRCGVPWRAAGRFSVRGDSLRGQSIPGAEMACELIRRLSLRRLCRRRSCSPPRTSG